MGFLNHATNNITVDAVLTDKGREILATSGRLDINRFALFDDEVDYSTIKKYGLIIGKEKIEKTTPVLEALTGQNVSLKYPLRTFDTNTTRNINKYPFLQRTETTDINLTFNNSALENTATITIKTKLNNVSTSYNLPSVLQDQNFTVSVYNRLLKVQNVTNFRTVGDKTIFEIPSIEPANLEFNGQKELTFNVSLQGTFTDDAFKNFSVYNNTNKIFTQIVITGIRSGSTLVLPIMITR